MSSSRKEEVLGCWEPVDGSVTIRDVVVHLQISEGLFRKGLTGRVVFITLEPKAAIDGRIELAEDVAALADSTSVCPHIFKFSPRDIELMINPFPR
jgi:hypothetical protein